MIPSGVSRRVLFLFREVFDPLNDSPRDHQHKHRVVVGRVIPSGVSRRIWALSRLPFSACRPQSGLHLSLVGIQTEKDGRHAHISFGLRFRFAARTVASTFHR